MRVRNWGLGRHYWVPHLGLCGPWCQSLSHVVFLLSQWEYNLLDEMVVLLTVSLWNTCGVDLLCRVACLFHMCSLSGRIQRKWVQDQCFSNFITSPISYTKALSYWFGYLVSFSKIFFPKILNPVLFISAFAVTPVLISESFLAFPLIPSIILFSSSLASGFLVCPVNCIHLLRQGCGGSVGQETPATSS